MTRSRHKVAKKGVREKGVMRKRDMIISEVKDKALRDTHYPLYEG
jgi:hypothetical protein